MGLGDGLNEDRKTVAIVGAGIVGVSTALWCLRDGHNVILIDKKAPGEGTSHGNGGVLAANSIIPVSTPGLWKKAPGMLLSPDQPLFLRWSYLPRLAPWLRQFLGHGTADHVTHRAASMTHMLGDTLDQHQALAKGTGAEKWIVPSDYVFLYRDRAHFEGDAFGWNLRRENGFAWDELEGTALKDYDPIWSADVGFGVRCANHGRITDPGRYVKDLAAHAETLGAQLMIGDASDVIRDGDRVTGVMVSGEPVDCDALVLAAGVWSKPLAEKLGVKVPIESERGYHLELWEPSHMPRAPVMIASGKFVATPMDGRLRCAGVVEFGGLDAPASKAPLKLLEKNIKAAIPGLTWKRTVEWMGHRPSVADSLPLIGEVSGAKGAFLGFGHDHVGLTAGPKTGRLLAQLIGNRKPNIDLGPFSPARYAEG